MAEEDAWMAASAPVDALMGTWRRWALAQDCISGNFSSAATIAWRQRRRLRELIDHARENVPLYRRLYARLPQQPGLASLPVVTKSMLMAEFNDSVADTAIDIAEIREFIADRERIGQPYLERYAVWTSSGSTGEPGIFVQDANALALYSTLLSTRTAGENPVGALWKAAIDGGRMAMIAALDGHYAGVVSWERMRRENPLLRERCRTFSLMQPLETLIGQLQSFSPNFIASYPTTMLLLAEARAAGRIDISPSTIWCGGETMTPAERAQIAAAFGCSVFEDYGASEFMSIAFDCGMGALHVNADWVVLEPIDEHGRAVPPGRASASVLLTNLANRVQPLIRYELGDSITVLEKPCRCGCPLPAIHVDGRRDDILEFVDTAGVECRFAPLAIESIVEEGSGLSRFQVIQRERNRIDIRFEPRAGEAPSSTYARIRDALETFLARQGVCGTRYHYDKTLPRADPVSGKFRQVVRDMRPKSRARTA